MQHKKGWGWNAFYDEENERYFGDHGGIQSYTLYEINKEQYEALTKNTTESQACSIMYDGGRRLYMSVNDRCGPPYTIVFDDDYEKLCPWAAVVRSGRVWPAELSAAKSVRSGRSRNPSRTPKAEKRHGHTIKCSSCRGGDNGV